MSKCRNGILQIYVSILSFSRHKIARLAIVICRQVFLSAVKLWILPLQIARKNTLNPQSSRCFLYVRYSYLHWFWVSAGRLVDVIFFYDIVSSGWNFYGSEPGGIEMRKHRMDSINPITPRQKDRFGALYSPPTQDQMNQICANTHARRRQHLYPTVLIGSTLICIVAAVMVRIWVL